ncbi:AI-2E family transporter [Cellulomonas sp. DKR-3]|uniref:AI-2E family transporter n=1 Tax=Cellulomonas fulva TaxID=2835530 RepID=A0ABS5TUS9_9CELL|nr:AI-2E family transporter [Cellulomonas fulva]MBT0992856.1 AI-2E family transporter [Cellulomonas fulva]
MTPTREPAPAAQQQTAPVTSAGPPEPAAAAGQGGTVGTDPAQAVPISVRRAAEWSWRLILIAVATVVVVALIAYLKLVVVPVAVALLLAVLLHPVVTFLHGRARLGKAAAAGIAVVGMVVLVVGLLVLAGRSVVVGMADLWDQAQQGIDQVMTWLAEGPLQLSTDNLQGWIDQAQEAASANSSTIAAGALHATVTIGHVLAGAVIALFCTFFFLLDGRSIWSWVVGLLPRGSREHVHQAGRRGLVTLGAYTRTQILVAAVDATGIGVGAAILQVPLAFPLAILVFLGSFIPIVGAVVTGAVAVLVALVAHGPVVALIMLAVVLGVQQLEGHVLQPFLMGHAVSLHPVAVLLGVAAGSFMAGILGALFAVPVIAVLNTVILYLHGHDKFPQLGHDDHVALRGRGHPVLDRAIAQMAEQEVERAATGDQVDLGEEPATGAETGAATDLDDAGGGEPGARDGRRGGDDEAGTLR